MKCEVITLTQERFTLIVVEEGQKLPKQDSLINIIKYEFIAKIEMNGNDRGSVQVNFVKGIRQ